MNAKECEKEIARLRKLVAQGYDVVMDFAPNIARCVLQDYGRWNRFCLEAKKVKDALEPLRMDYAGKKRVKCRECRREVLQGQPCVIDADERVIHEHCEETKKTRGATSHGT